MGKKGQMRKQHILYPKEGYYTTQFYRPARIPRLNSIQRSYCTTHHCKIVINNQCNHNNQIKQCLVILSGCIEIPHFFEAHISLQLDEHKTLKHTKNFITLFISTSNSHTFHHYLCYFLLGIPWFNLHILLLIKKLILFK